MPLCKEYTILLFIDRPSVNMLSLKQLSYVMMRGDQNIIYLSDNRQLAYAEYGDPDGYPIFYFHGFPGSRLEARQFHDIALLRRFRIIGIDRPGMGLSTFKQHRTILSWANDLIALADYLKIRQFALVGHSASSAYLAACAWALPERLNHVTMISGMAPLNVDQALSSMSKDRRIACQLIKVLPITAKLIMWLTYRKLIKGKMEMGILPEVDRVVFQDDYYQAYFSENLREAFKKGTLGPSHEMQLICNPWGFDLKQIKIPITIWHGTSDTCIPITHAEILSQYIPHSQLNIIENEGHISILKNTIERVFDQLVI